jgi:hypothetical protein
VNSNMGEQFTAGEVIERLGRPILRTHDLSIDVVPNGPDASVVAEISRALLREDWLREHLSGTEHRLLSFEIADDGGDKRSQVPAASTRFLATIYDYTNNRTLVVDGSLENLDSARLFESGRQPLPNDEEFEAAVENLASHHELGPAIRQNDLRTYRPMPPLVDIDLPDGRIERTIAVGLLSPSGDIRHRIVGVNMIQRRVLEELPHIPLPSHDECGSPPVGGCEASGITGRVSVTVRQGGRTVWTFDAIRPAASSGTNGSGIELRNVRYRGKQVLFQAHVPILNVEYYSDGISVGCGPTYRDWQNSETCFQANGTDVIPGFRLCPTPAQTILETGTDAGNFRGVAIYVQGQEVVLVSELQAGWYRYISEWRFHTDGTIRPRFGFAATDNPCTCKVHHHHVYWRFDFDIRTASRNVVDEFNNPSLVGSSNWHVKHFEIRRLRDPSRNRHWRIRNLTSGEGYLLIPGSADGSADAYGVGDMWVLLYRGPSEVDDGQGFTTVPALSRANIDKFLNFDVVEDRDVVVWYVGHFQHTPAHAGGHRVGPDLKPFNW